MKKILIIGSRGYLGSYLFDYLRKKSLEVTGIDNNLYGNTFIKDYKSKHINKDIRDLDIKFLEKFESVICLAALSNNPINKKKQKIPYDLTKNYTKNLASKISKIGNKLIFPSSCSVYGYQKPNKLANESSQLNPLTFYSQNKVEIENILKKKNIKSKLNCIIIRPATVFGFSPSIRFDLVVNMLIGMAITEKQILLNSDGMAIRPFIYIDDLANFFLKSIHYDKKNFLIINAGNNNYNFSIREVAEKISKMLSVNYYFSNNKKMRSIHKDDLIQNMQDKRSYRVSFDLAENKFNINSNNDFNSKLYKTYLDIKKILKENNFYSKNFYRLHKLRYLINNKMLDADKLKRL
jgi:nucleoside-diphosphate-sugar epimerase